MAREQDEDRDPMTTPEERARRRFLTLAEVGEELQVSKAQAYALVRAGTLPGIKIGGRGQWRVEAVMLETMISRAYVETRTLVAEHPLAGPPNEDDPHT